MLKLALHEAKCPVNPANLLVRNAAANNLYPTGCKHCSRRVLQEAADRSREMCCQLIGHNLVRTVLAGITKTISH